MNREKESSSIGDEVEKRLEDLFAEATDDFVESSDEEPDPEQEEVTRDSTLTGLKTVIMSIEWEINDHIMTRLMEEARVLMDNYKDDRVVFMLLRLLGSIGKYIKSHKAKAHPMAVTMLNSIYSNLEQVILGEALTRKEKEKILASQVSEFKKLKAEIAKRREGMHREKAEETPVAEGPALGQEAHQEEEEEEVEIGPDQVQGYVEESAQGLSAEKDTGLDLKTQEAVNIVLEEVKKVIRSEFEALRAELRHWGREGN